MCKNKIDKNELLQLHSQNVQNYIYSCLNYMNLPVDAVIIKPIDPDDEKIKSYIDSKRKLHYGQKNPGYYGYIHEKNTLIYDLEDIHKNEIQQKSGEWKYKILHEVRHVYQHIQVDNYLNGVQVSENIDTIKKWEDEFKNKKVANTFHITEQDANEYSLNNWNKIPPIATE